MSEQKDLFAQESVKLTQLIVSDRLTSEKGWTTSVRGLWSAAQRGDESVISQRWYVGDVKNCQMYALVEMDIEPEGRETK